MENKIRKKHNQRYYQQKMNTGISVLGKHCENMQGPHTGLDSLSRVSEFLDASSQRSTGLSCQRLVRGILVLCFKWMLMRRLACPIFLGMMCAKENFIILEGDLWKKGWCGTTDISELFPSLTKDLKQADCMYMCGGLHMGAQCLGRAEDYGIISTRAEVPNLPHFIQFLMTWWLQL